MTRRLLAALSLAGIGAFAPVSTATAQTPTRKVAVLSFDQRTVADGFNDLFGRGDVDVGRSLARLVARRLAEAGGFEIVEVSGAVPLEADPATAAAAARSVGADAVIAGSLLAYGSQSATAGVRGPGVGGVRLGIGRRTTVAAVSLEARLIDVRSGTLLAMIPAQTTANRSGLALFARVPGLISADGVIDMTREEFSRTLIGEATGTAVQQLVTEVSASRDRIGAVEAAPPPAMAVSAAPMAAAAPGMVAAAPGGPFAWAPYTFRGTEHFRYTVTRTEDRQVHNGFYQLDLQPAGTGQVRMRVQGQLGEDSFSNTVTVPVATEGGNPMAMGMGFGQLMAMGPIGIALFNPGSWMFLYGRQLTIGDEWSQSSGGESYSVKVEDACGHGGQNGVRVVTRVNGQVQMESCLAQQVALPLRVLIVDEDSRMEMTLTEYRP